MRVRGCRVVKPGGMVILTDSGQLGDRRALDRTLGNFGGRLPAQPPRAARRSRLALPRGRAPGLRLAAPSSSCCWCVSRIIPLSCLALLVSHDSCCFFCRADFNEPHYREYIADDLGGMFEAAGLVCDSKVRRRPWPCLPWPWPSLAPALPGWQPGQPPNCCTRRCSARAAPAS